MTVVKKISPERMVCHDQGMRKRARFALGTDEQATGAVGYGPTLWGRAAKMALLCGRGWKSLCNAISLGSERPLKGLQKNMGRQWTWPLAAVRTQAWPRWRLAVNGSYSQGLQGVPRGAQGRHRWLVMPDDHSVTKWRLDSCHKTWRPGFRWGNHYPIDSSLRHFLVMPCLGPLCTSPAVFGVPRYFCLSSVSISLRSLLQSPPRQTTKLA